MSQYVKVLQHNGGFISLLADDDGVIQFTTNDGDFDGIVADSAVAISALTGDVTATGPGSVAATIGAGKITTGMFDAAAVAPAATTATSATTATKANLWTRVDVGSSVQDVTISGLAGNSDGTYELMGTILNPSGSLSILSLQPNTLTTNQATNEIYITPGGPAPAKASSAVLVLGAAEATNGYCIFHMFVNPKAGVPRSTFGQYQSVASNGSYGIYSNPSGIWHETTTAITSLVIHSDQATGIGVGSSILWRKVPT